MQTLRFDFRGPRELVLPDGGTAIDCALDIIEGRSYPWPRSERPVVVADIGANVGEFAVMAALVWPDAAVVAWEPRPEAFEMLQRNCAPHKNITVFRETGDGAEWKAASIARGVKALRPEVLKIEAGGAEYEILHCMRPIESRYVCLKFHSEAGRLAVDSLLSKTHSLYSSRQNNQSQGELMYARR